MNDPYYTVRGVRVDVWRHCDRTERIWRTGAALVLFTAAFLAFLKMLAALLLPS
jgi:hypothetical protein